MGPVLGETVTVVSEALTAWRRPDVPLELLDPAEMAQADRLAAAHVASLTLMENAGSAVAQCALRLVGPCGGRRIVVLCGPGNNGGDGYVAARLIATAGCEVTVATLVARETLRGDAAAAAARWSGPIVPLAEADLDGVDLVIDALFGAGLTRAIDGIAHSAIDRVNIWSKTKRRPVLAVDMPSGVDGASGAIRGTAVAATDTITFFRLKPGHILLPGRLRCGVVVLADIGIAPDVLDSVQPQTWLNVPPLWSRAYPVPRLDGHKYARGHALVVSGPVAQTGAARLCARGALRIGAGLVTVATPPEALQVHAGSLTAIMTRVSEGPDGLAGLLADPRKNAVVLGPGLGVGAATRELVAAALRPVADGAPCRSIVLDADALSSFADAPRTLFDTIAAGGHTVLLTPHDGEFAKLFGGVLDVSQPKPQRARVAAAMSGATVILKGPDTIVAHPDGRLAIAASEAPWLATAGSGDVLAGMAVGLLAQAMPPFEAGAAAVWLHAEAARRFGAGLISEDIPELLPSVLSDLMASPLIAGT